jgi:hypothetical protein
MSSIARRDKGKNPGTQTSGSPEGAVPDGEMAIEVTIKLQGSPSAVAADYATLVGTTLTVPNPTATWKKV